MTERQIGCYLSIMTPIHPIGTFPINYIPCYPISKAIFGYVLILRGWRRLRFLGSQFHIYPRMGHSYDLNSNTVRALF